MTFALLSNFIYLQLTVFTCYQSILNSFIEAQKPVTIHKFHKYAV